MEFIKFIFSNFWYFIGFVLILQIIVKAIYGIIHKVIRHRTIMKHGYPPPHCDGDGDFLKEQDQE